MKKTVAILLTLVLLLGISTVALAKNPHQSTPTTNTTTATTLPEFSKYVYSYTLPDYIIPDKEAIVGVNLKTLILGQKGYTDVHFELDTTCKATEDNHDDGTIKYTVTNSGHTYTFTNDGTWGEPTGFDLAANATKTNNLSLLASKAGEYTITLKALDGDDNVIVESSQNIIVTASLFTLKVPAKIYAEETTEATLRFITGESFDNVHFAAKADGPGDVKFEKKGTDDTHTNSITWGNDIDINAPYDSTTEWNLTFSKEGTYTLTYQLVDNDDDVIFASAKKLTILASALSNDDEDEDEDKDDESSKGQTHGLLNALKNHLKIRGNGKSQANSQSTSRLLELLQDRGLSLEEIKTAIGSLEDAIKTDGDGTTDDFKLLGIMYEREGKKYATYINGSRTEFDVPPTLENGRTLVPFRKIAEDLGAQVTWDAAAKKVTLTKGDTTVVLTLGAKTALVNGKDVALDTPAKIQKNRVLVPLRFISEALNANVDYYPEGSLIVIKKHDIR